MKIKDLVTLFFLFLLLYPHCPEGSSRVIVPAVLGDSEKGGLAEFTVQIKNGSGKVYTAVSPKVDVTVQLSEEIASFVGFKYLNLSQEECDVFFTIKEEELGANSINGMSGGAGMALGVIAAATNRTIGKGIAITGTIEPDGSIGSVSGIIEKAEAARRGGLVYLIAPKRSFFETLLFSTVNTSIRIIEAANIDEVVQIALFGKIEKNESRLNVERLPVNISENDIGKRRDAVKLLAKEMLVENFDVELNEKTKEYFRIRKENAETLFEKGYYYSSANEAFLLWIDLEFLKLLEEGRDIAWSATRNEECLSKLESKKISPTDINWEFYVGSKLRERWSKKKISDTLNKTPRVSEERGYLLRESLYSFGWCRVSNRLADMAISYEQSSSRIDENSFKQMAADKIYVAKNLVGKGGIVDEEALWRLENAEILYEDGEYLASIFDSTYVYAIHSARLEALKTAPEELEKKVLDFLKWEYNGTWAGAYASHGKYLYEADNKANLIIAYYSLRFASELEKATNEIERKILDLKKENLKNKNDRLEVEEKREGVEQSFYSKMREVLIIGAVLALAALLVMFLLLRFRKRKKGKRKI
ncbi:MAG: S16 family serine protease [Candidatus Anstonellales archaeon]